MTQDNPTKSNIGQWTLPTIAAIALMLVMFGYYPKHISNKPAINFVSVLSDEQTLPLLTIVGNNQENHFWLTWGDNSKTLRSQVQLWVHTEQGEQLLKTLRTETKNLSLNNEQSASLAGALRLSLSSGSADNPQKLAEGAAIHLKN